MFCAGDRVRIRETGRAGKVVRVYGVVKGVVLDKRLAIVRLDDPDPAGFTLTTAFEDELEAEGPEAGRVAP